MQRAWIIGNGPSLKDTPLHLLKDEVCFATGRIGMIFNQTEWRPTHYARLDDVQGWDEKVVSEDLKAIFQVGMKCLLSTAYRWIWDNLRRFEKPNNCVEFIPECQHHNLHYDNREKPTAWHLPEICWYGNSGTAAIQWAAKLGYGPLYLVGFDLGYKDGAPSHFAEGYEQGPERPAKYSNGDAKDGLRIAQAYCPNGLYNATIGGSVPKFIKRVDMLEVLNG